MEEVIQTIKLAHMNGDPDTLEGVVNICKEIYAELDGQWDTDWWTADAMITIAEKAFIAGKED